MKYLVTWSNSEQRNLESQARFDSLSEARAKVASFTASLGDYGRPYTITWSIEQVFPVQHGTTTTEEK